MSGFEVIGVVLGVYPLVVTAWEAFSQVKGDKGVQALIRRLKIEETIYREFVDHLLGPNASEAQRCRLTATGSGNLGAWRDIALQSNLKDRLGFGKAELIVSILNDLSILLDSMKNDLPGAGRSFESRSLKFLKTFKQNLPQSPLKKHIELLKDYNDALQRLLSERGPPSSDGLWKQPIPTLQFQGQDSGFAIGIYNAICDGYRCDCDKAHYANFELPEITACKPQNIKGAEGAKSGKQKLLSHNDRRRLQLLFLIEDPAAIEDSVASTVISRLLRNHDNKAEDDEETLVDGEEFNDVHSRSERANTLLARPISTASSPNIPTDQGGRSVSVSECPDDQSDTIEDLCRYVRALRGADIIPNLEFSDITGILSSKEKRYKLQDPASKSTVPLVTKMADALSPLSRRVRKLSELKFFHFG